jgi:RNA polymerase sigma factor (sigma-70 family)
MSEHIRRHRDAVHRYLTRFVPRDHVDDLLQMTFTAAWERRHEIDDPKVWFFSVAHNKIADFHRRRGLEQRLLVKLSADPQFYDGDIGSSELRIAVSRAWNRLPRQQRETLYLTYRLDFDDATIARILRVTPANVRQIRKRALDRLRAVLGDNWDRRATSRTSGGRGRS